MADMETEVKTKEKLQPDTGRRQAQTPAFSQVQNQAQNQEPAQDKLQNQAQYQELAQDKPQNRPRNQSQNQSQSGNPWADLSLEEGMEKLDELLTVLEDPDIPLEKAFALYQQGVGLLKHCSGRIDTVEKKILMMNGDGGFDEFG